MYNYHTHTRRCGHASGKDEDYVLAAIKEGYQGLGFSDHVMLPNVISDSVRGRYEQKDEYLQSIRNLQKKYQDQIEIYVGFECEWDRNFEKYYRSLIENKEVDYLIFGNHSCYFKNGEHGLKIFSKSVYLKRYLKKTLAAFKSGLFPIMAHPDLFMCSVPWNKSAKKVALTICKEAKKHNIALELNCGCFINDQKANLFGENRFRYPYKEFWKIAKKVGNTIIVGIDAHSPSALNSPKKQLMNDFIKELNLTITPKIAIERNK